MARAHERFAAERRRARRRRRKRGRGALPNLLVIGGLKCGTTSLHHYLNLHPEVAMSRPKELNFFVAELNWPLGADWYASHFDAGTRVRGESSPHYTNRPAVRRRRRADARRCSAGPESSTWSATRSTGCCRTTSTTSAADTSTARWPRRWPIRSRATWPEAATAFQLEPYLEAFGPERIEIVTREELKRDRPATMRRVFGFLGVDPGFTSEQFEREWETGTAKGGDRFRLMDRAVRLPGLRALDRNFDRLPESLRWLVERIVHDPGAGEVPKPEVPPRLRERLEGLFRDDVGRLEELAGRRFGWLD